MKFPHLTHPHYRADIDGLRAIAVLAVVGFHAFPQWVTGGFIGVDIFFVISGFLISTIIMGSLERNSFSFIEFFSRRINRIFPALILVLIACFSFGWFELLADEYQQLGKHIAGGAGFISNYLFWDESGYFDTAAEKKPLLHLWSLGIEEQFYIIWPFIMWLAWKRKKSLLITSIAIVLLSFVLNIGTVRGDTVAAFYSPQTRFWELLVGSILAYITMHKLTVFSGLKNQLGAYVEQIFHTQTPEENDRILKDIQSILGISLIAIGFVVINKEGQFPGWWAVLPTLGAVLIISSGKQAWFNRVILSNRMLVWFGLISFPLYLWHWPLLSFAHIEAGGELMTEVRGALVLVSIALAWLTYRFLEKPLRNIKANKTKTVSLFLLMVVVGGVGYGTYKYEGFRFRVHTPQLQNRVSHLVECDDQPCIYGNKSSEKVIVVYGDSFAGHLTTALKESIGSEYKVFSFVAGSCFFGENIYRIGEQSKACELMKESVKKLQGKKIYAVIRAQRWQGYGVWQKPVIEDIINDAVNTFSLHPEKIIIIGSTADVDINCEISNYYSFRSYKKDQCKPYEESKKINNSFISVTSDMKFSQDVHFIYPYKKLCPSGDCMIIEGSVLYYSDKMHMSKDGALLLMPEIVQILKD